MLMTRRRNSNQIAIKTIMTNKRPEVSKMVSVSTIKMLLFTRRNHSTSLVMLTLALVALCCSSVSNCLMEAEALQQQRQDSLDRHHNQIVIPKLSSQQHKNATTTTYNAQVQQKMSKVGDLAPSSTAATMISTTTLASENRSSQTSTPATTTTTTTTTTAVSSKVVSTATPKQRRASSSSATNQDRSSSSSSAAAAASLPALKNQRNNNGDEQMAQSESRDQQSVKVKSNNKDAINQLPASQSVSFAETAAAVSLVATTSANLDRQQQQQHKRQPKSSAGSNRWTHFGARLRPLNAVHGSSGKQDELSEHDHAQAANSKSYSTAYNLQQQRPTQQQQQQQRQAASRQQQQKAALALNSNQVGDLEDSDEDDDDQDSEALLYKMMQQHGFLMNPIWLQQQQAGAQHTERQPAAGSINGDGGNGAAAGGQQLTASNSGAASQQQQLQQLMGNSKRVIKLLKSYSHIHQVDDSDDQIRGTYTRLAARRLTQQQPQATGTSQSNQYNRNRSTRAKQPANQIFVSSQGINGRPGVASAQGIAGRQQRQRQQQLVSTESSFGESSGRANENYPHGAANQLEDSDSSSLSSSGDSDDSSPSSPAPSEEDDFECPNNGIFADESSGCQAYHVCQSGAQVQQKFQCPMGTLFNNIILTCDFAHNVQCNGKSKYSSSSVGATLQSEQLQPAEQPQQQQQPQAQQSQLLQQSGYTDAQQPSAALPKQQYRWMRPQLQQASLPRQQQQQQQGPRPLVIGQSSQNLGANLPLARPLSNDADNEDSDDEPLVPLVPATLAPRPAPRAARLGAAPPTGTVVAVGQTLPYNPAPRPTTGQQQQQLRQHQNQQQRQLQAIHPAQHRQPTERTPVLAKYDALSAAAVTPVFIRHDGSSGTTEASYYAAVASSAQAQPATLGTPSAAGIANQQEQQLNLVINHVAPTSQTIQQQPQGNGIAKLANPSHQASVVAKQINANSKLVSAGQPAAISYKKKSLVRVVAIKKQPTQSTVNASNQQQQVATLPQASVAARQQQQQRSAKLRANSNFDSQPKAQASQEPKSVAWLANANQQQASSSAANRAALVDLTNDKRAGVSSEALNDGLLLVVRHSSGSSPIQVGMGARQDYGSANKQAQQLLANQSNGNSQAFAVDPSIVRGDSPVDAQLFPNVQRVIVAAQSRPAVSHQAALQSPPPLASSPSSSLALASPAAHLSSSSQLIQHVTHPAQRQQQQQSYQVQSGANQHQSARILSAPLPPMEPPKPTVVDGSNGESQQYGDSSSGTGSSTDSAGFDLQPVAASSSSLSSSSVASAPTAESSLPSTSTSSRATNLAKKASQQQVQKSQKQRSRRAKRLKAAPSPTNSPVASPSSSTASSAHQQQRQQLQKQRQPKSVKPKKSETAATNTSGSSNSENQPIAEASNGGDSQPVAIVDHKRSSRLTSRTL